MSAPPSSQLQDQVENLVKSDISSQGKIGELMKLLEKARKTRESPISGQDCPEEDDDDCRDILSLCCGAPISTVFGTLPIMARCQECGREQRLREIVSALPDS